MSYYYSRKLQIPFEEAVRKITQSLQREGFGIITNVDLKDVFKRKLNVGFGKYKILGACNPELAYKAVTLESHIGLMLPCNIVVQQDDDSSVEVSAINPLETIANATTITQLRDIAHEVGNRLRSAVDNLYREVSEKQPEPLHNRW